MSDRSTVDVYEAILSPGKRLLTLPNFSAIARPEVRAALEARLPNWVGELIERGVAERKARQLALDVPDQQPVLDQIEYAEHLIAQDRRGRGKITNPAGFLIWAIESNLSVPVDFQTSRRSNFERHRNRLRWSSNSEYSDFRTNTSNSA
jgi:hypothetical protein